MAFARIAFILLIVPTCGFIIIPWLIVEIFVYAAKPQGATVTSAGQVPLPRGETWQMAGPTNEDAEEMTDFTWVSS